MAYSKFLDLGEVADKFSLSLARQPLFSNCEPVPISAFLQEAISDASAYGLLTEKERSERIVWPFLKEISKRNERKIVIYSGHQLNIDPKNGLNGECDFLLSYGTIPEVLAAPLFSVVEAKKQDMDYGMAQCTAQMLGAQLLNRNRKFPVRKIYGATTTGKEWRFLSLENTVLTIDENTFFMDDAPGLVGYMQCIFDEFKRENNIA